MPGLIGFIGNLLGREGVNIADMSLGRSQDEAGGDSVAVLHLDQCPSEEAMREIADHAEVTGVRAVKLPARGEALPGVLAAAG